MLDLGRRGLECGCGRRDRGNDRGLDAQEARLDDVLHGPAHFDLAEGQPGTDLADGGTAAGRHHDLPPLGIDDHFGTRQRGRQSDERFERRHHCFNLEPFREQALGIAQDRVDLDGGTRVGGGDLGLEDERAFVVAEQFEDYERQRFRGLGRRRVGRDHTATVEPDAPGTTIGGDAKASGFPRGGEQAEDVGECERIEGPLQGHGDLPLLTGATSPYRQWAKGPKECSKTCSSIAQLVAGRRDHHLDRRRLPGPEGKRPGGLMSEHPDAVDGHGAHRPRRLQEAGVDG